MEIPIIRMNNGWLLIMVTHQGAPRWKESVRFSVDNNSTSNMCNFSKI